MTEQKTEDSEVERYRYRSVTVIQVVLKPPMTSRDGRSPAPSLSNLKLQVLLPAQHRLLIISVAFGAIKSPWRKCSAR